MKKLVAAFFLICIGSYAWTQSVHCLGNGNYCVYEKGVAIQDLFGPTYSSPAYIQSDLQDKGLRTVSVRQQGTAIWKHTIFRKEILVAEITDFVDSRWPALIRIIHAKESFTLNLNIWNYPEIHTFLNAGDYRGYVSGALLIRKDRGLNIMQRYAHPEEQFHQILLQKNAALRTTDKPDFFDIIIQPGESVISFVGGPGYKECIENTRYILSADPKELLLRTQKEWEVYTSRRKDFKSLIPEKNPHKKQILDQIDNVAVLLKTQQAKEGAVLAGTAYHMAYVRDQYGVSRGFLALGYHEEARMILDFYWKIWQKFGLLHNAQAIGIPGIFHIHENDEVEQTGYLIIQAFDYLKATRDTQFVNTIVPMLQWAWNVQKKNLVHNMLPFNGDETYVAGGLLPRTALNDGSAESTLLFIRSGELLLPYLQKSNLWDQDSITTDTKLVADVKNQYRTNFIKDGRLITNNPDRMSVADMPEFRHGVCMGGHGVVSTRKDSNGYYLCPVCFAEKQTFPPIDRKTYFLPSIALTPVFIGSDIIPDEIKKNIEAIRLSYSNDGTISSRPGEKTVIGYEYGFLLFAFSKYHQPTAEKVFTDMMSVVDDAGAWVEYYENGKPKGCPYRPWESAINIAAIIQYTTDKK